MKKNLTATLPKLIHHYRLGLQKFSAIIIVSSVIASCAPQYNHHGHVFTDEEIKQIQPGMSEAQVKLALGSPATKSPIGGGGAYYYISSKQKRAMAFQRSTVIDRKVLAVYFNKNKEVERIANFGLQDGKIVDFNDKTTKSYKGSDSVIQNIFKTIGRRRMFDQGGSSGDE